MARPADIMESAAKSSPRLGRASVGWRIFAMLVGFGAIAYFQQKGVTIAAERIMPELSLSQMQIGWIQWAFLLAYTPGQLIGGRVGQWFGARSTLAVAGAVAVIATIAAPLVPTVLTGGAVFAGLFLSQLTLGFAQAPTFPVGAGIVRTWLPAGRWGVANGIQSMGAQLGAAVAPAAIVFCMQKFGWQRALFWTALPALGLVFTWAWYVRNTPCDHPSVSSEELAELEPSRAASTGFAFKATSRTKLPARDLALLTASYVGMNYVFYLLSNWSFLYLIQQRHFTVVDGGWLATLPPIGAALGAGIGGWAADALCLRLGARWGYRLVPLIALPTVALLLVLAVYVDNPFAAVIAMTLCYGVVELNEGAYWAAMIRLSGPNTMSAAGVLNTGGSLGGLIGIPVVAFLSGHGAWNAAFLVGALCAALSAAAWFGVDATRNERKIVRQAGVENR
jgi:MFS transporter, ACS family, glucarate transporter